METVTGIDIGGTHISASICDIESGRILEPTLSRQNINPHLDAAAVIEQWCVAINDCHAKAGIAIDKLGIAIPGPFDYEQGISLIKGLNKYEQLYGLNVKDLLANRLKITPQDIRMINDASAYLMGEMHGGAGRDYDNVVGITLGTGLGSASFYDGRLHEGDLWCMPYLDSRAEDYACARWFIATFEDKSGLRASEVKVIADRTLHDPSAAQSFHEFGTHLGRILVKRYAAQNPELVVIGGNISKAWDHFIVATNEILNCNGFEWKLVPATLGEEAALLGAACLWNL